MITALLYSTQLSIIGLLALMFFRVNALYKESYSEEQNHVTSILDKLLEGHIKVNDAYDKKMECLKNAQIFAGVQMLEIKRSYDQLHHKNMSWLREAISLYLIGAVDFIGKQANCGPATRKELISIVLKSNLQLSDFVTSQYFEEALYRQFSSEKDLMVRAGAKAAKAWLSDNQVPEGLTLSFQLNDWGVFA
jgi:hypothetical protein